MQNMIKTETSLRTFFDTANEGIWVLNTDKQTINVNRSLRNILGDNEQHLLQTSIFDYLDPDNYQRLREQLEKALWSNSEQHFELLLRRTDGKKICCQCNTATIADEQNNIIGAFVMITDITQRKAAEQALYESRIRMENLSMFQQTALEMERKRIARELHDELGQTMTALHFDLKWLTENTSSERGDVHNKLLSMKNLVSRTVDSIRRISEDLRPGMLDDLGLAAAIEHHVSKFSKQSNIECELYMSNSEFDLDEQVSTALFRIVQESLTNVARHSGASRVTIRLQELAEQVILIVQDNGRGFPDSNEHNKKTYGLLGMRERVKVLRGSLDIFNEAGAGARIEACVPKHINRHDNQDSYSR